jgi:hypothetical protein
MGRLRKLQSILEAARKRFRAGGGIPHDEFWKRVEAQSACRLEKRNGKPRSGRRTKKRTQ